MSPPADNGVSRIFAWEMSGQFGFAMKPQRHTGHVKAMYMFYDADESPFRS